MKKFVFLFILLMFVINVYPQSAQKMEYTTQPALMNYPDAIQMVANISGYHHLLGISYDEHPAIYIFDTNLKFISKKVIPFKVPENAEIKVLGFQQYYILYFHIPRSLKYFVWKIDGEGNFISLSAQFQTLMQSQFKRRSENFQLVNAENKLYIIAHTYYPDLEKIETTVVEADNMLNPVIARGVSFNFKMQEEKLQQVTMAGSHHLIILKTANRYSGQNGLALIKIDLDNASGITKNFTGTGYLYSESSFKINAADSTITVYSMLREPVHRDQIVFISCLNNSLKELSPITLLKQHAKNLAASFLLLNGQNPQWLSIAAKTTERYYPVYERLTTENFAGDELYSRNRIRINSTERYSFSERFSRSTPLGIHFTLLNKQLETVVDSIVPNDKRAYYIYPKEFASFTIKSKSYLLLEQFFSARRKGLLLVYGGKNYFNNIDVRVYDRYDYLLSQLEPTPDGAVIIPYINKREAGILKFKIEENSF